MTTTIDIIRSVLQQHRSTRDSSLGLKHAAVLVPIVKKDHSLHLLLTKRTDSVEHHKGQISFPGGMEERSDESPVFTALRETEEEIGIPHSSVSVIGMLDDFHIPTGFIVTPVVGYIEHLPDLRISSDEVAEVLFVPLEKFFNDQLRRSEKRELAGIRREVFFYDVWKEPVWGATAHIIKELTDLFVP
jgi:8-oxo-dGTP pyrophosphatase MutT (NUDIX family)